MSEPLELTLDEYRKMATTKVSKMNPAESQWGRDGPVILVLEFFPKTSSVLSTDFEPETFNAAGIKYTPDFRHIIEDENGAGTVVFVEVKSSKHAPKMEYSVARMRVAANLNPWYVFILATLEGGAWKLRRIT